MMLGINTQGSINGIQSEMLTEPKGIGHLNDEDAEGIQAERGGYADITLTNRIFIVMRVQKKDSYCSCNGSNTSVDSEK